MNRVATFLLLSFVFVPSLVFAADEAYGDGEASKGGLPQFDPTWFASQIFWLAVCFGVLYLIFAKKTLPDISSTIENRKNHIQSDLEMAEKLTAEADSVHDAYQENLVKAQTEAANAIKNVEAQAKAEADEATENFRQKSEATIVEVEQKIEASKDAAMNDMNQIVVDTAAQAVEKIIGIKADAAKLGDIVQSINSIPSSKKSKAA
jgi:F-type H+-transporting ATPase subunit b